MTPPQRPGDGSSDRQAGASEPTPTSGALFGPHDDAAEWLRVTLTSIGDGVITTDGNGKVTFLNPVAQALTGWTHEQAVSRDLQQVFHIVNQDTRAEVENPALRALKEGLIVGLANHTILIARDGGERNIDDSAAPIRNRAGETAGSVLVFRDITERYAQERAIKEAKEFAESILATQHEPFLVLGNDLTVVASNRAFHETFEIAREHTLGLPIWEVDDRAFDIERLRELLENVLSQGRPFHGFEVAHTFERVGHKTMVLNASRIVTPSDTADLILLSISDITQRREAEASLRDSERRYRRLFESAKDGILIVDPITRKIIDANPYIAELIGVAPSELLGKELWEIGLFGDIELNRAAFRTLQRYGYVQYDNLPLENVRGETVEVEFVSNVYAQNEHAVAQCNIRSIAERRLREQTRALADENRRKDEFLAMLSHELRNPLAPIRTAAHLLRLQERLGQENATQREAREVIERQTAHLSRLVNDLLEVSRVISGHVRLNMATLDIREVIQHAIETVKPLVNQRRHTLEVSLPDEAVCVRADATRLEEVVNNLLINAAKYTDDDGRGRVSVRLSIEHQSPDDSGHAVLSVADNGEGLETDLLRHGRLFDLFSQGKRSLDRSQGGLGIGLTLVHRLLELQGGTIEANSAGPGRGSEFIVRMPLSALRTPHCQEEDEPGRATTGQALGAGPVAAGAGKLEAPEGEPHGAARRAPPRRVLIVDDNADHASMIAAVMRQLGCSVQIAHSGPAGLQAALDWRPDVALLDIGLPGLDGCEIARKLRQDERNAIREMRLIAITGYGQPADRERTRSAGFDAHLTKPFDAHVLQDLIDHPRR
jgi:PAS domain S-box-containing protein